MRFSTGTEGMHSLDTKIRVFQALLGHESIKTTEIYLHTDTEQCKKAYKMRKTNPTRRGWGTNIESLSGQFITTLFKGTAAGVTHPALRALSQ